MAFDPAVDFRPPRRGLGVAALVLGIAAILTLAFCGLGVLLAVAGVVVGIMAVVRDNGRGMAVAGLLLSAFTLVIAVGAGVWLYTRVAPCGDRTRYPTPAGRDHCLQERVPFFKASPRAMP